MWLIVSGDGDVPYTRAYGPYPTKEEATTDLPTDTDDIRWAVIELEDPTKIIHDGELVDDTDTTTVATQTPQPASTPTTPIDNLLQQYGAIENIPAPNTAVYAYANNEINRLKQNIYKQGFDKSFFSEDEANQIAAMLQAIGIPANEANFAQPGPYDNAIQEAQVQIMFYEELARKHRPRVGF